jgi:dihydroneopterin aldolase
MTFDFVSQTYAMDFSNVVKSVEQEAYDQVEKLNQHIFEKHMSRIKQIMTIAILETQALLDTIYVSDKKFV